MYHIFIHSFVDVHLDCFRALAIINIATVNIGVYMCLLELWFSRVICPVVGLLGHMVDDLDPDW